MMYWIVFALFTSAETFSDVLLAFWFPFYYELKICTLIWLLAPATNGSSLLYKKFVHPALVKREREIDTMLEEAKSRGYNTAVQLGGRGARYITSMVMEGMVRAPTMMAELVQTGQLGIEARAIEDVTDRAGPSSQTNAAAGPMDIDMSDNEIPEQRGATESDFTLDSDAEEKPKRGRKKKEQTVAATGKGDKAKKTRKTKTAANTADLTLSSGDDEEEEENREDPEFKLPAKPAPKKSTRKTRNTKQ